MEEGYEEVLETHWLLTRTTAVCFLQMDIQVGSQVGNKAGDRSVTASFYPVFPCACVCACTQHLERLLCHVREEIHQ